MRFRHFFIFTLLFLLTFTACETDFELDAEYKDITIVYGLLERTEPGSQSDTTFIKITRAFLGGDAVNVAMIRDSSEYQEKLNVTLTEMDEYGQVQGSPWTFDTVTRHNKDTMGDFYAPTHQMYYAIMPVDEDAIYKLKILVGNKEITSQTGVINKFAITRPGPNIIINYKPDQELPFKWVVSYDARGYEAVIRFYYKEVWEEGTAPGDADTVYRYLDWYKTKKVNETKPVGDEISAYYPTNLFYSSVANLVPYPDPQKESKVVARYTGPAEYIVSAATEDLETYVLVNNVNSNSIVLDRPEFTNINNGLGLFSSRIMIDKSKSLSTDTKDRLTNLGVKFEY